MARELELQLPTNPSQVDLEALLATFPNLRTIKFRTFREDWQCTLQLEQCPSSFPWHLQLLSIHKERSVTGLSLVDPAFAIVGPHQKFTLTSIRSEQGNVLGEIFFANVVVNGDLTEAGRRIFSTIRLFDFLMLPGDWQQTLLTMLPAMPGLQRLQLFNPGPRPYLEIDLIIRTIREHCPDLITLEFSCDWPLPMDLFDSAGVWDSCKHLLIKIDKYESSEVDGLEEMVQQSLESRWTGRRLQDIHLWIHHDQSYSSRDFAIELRSVLPFCDIFVEYRNGYSSPYSSPHLAELNHLLRRHHYASIESLTAAQLFP